MSLKDDNLFDFVQDLIITIRPTGELRLANAPALAALGLSQKELSGRNLSEWLLLDSLEEWETCLEAAEAGVAVNGANITLRTDDDPTMMVEANLQPTADQIVVSLRSLSEEQKVRQALRESEARFRTLLNSLPDLIMIFDRHGRYRQVYTNETDALVAPPEELLGKTLEEVVSPPEAKIGLDRIQQVIKAQEPLHFEYELCIDEKKRWFSAKVLPYGTERDPCVLWVARDITTRVQAREEKERDQQLLRDLLKLEQKARDVVAYEIHDGFVQYAVGTQMWLQSGIDQCESLNEDAHDALTTALDAIEHAISDARRMIRDLRPVALDEEGLVDGLRQLVEAAQKKSTIPITFAHEGNPPALLNLLETQIFRMVQESLNNVIRHSNASKAKVQLTVTEEAILVQIEDNGSGFDVNQIPHGHYGIEGIFRRASVFGGKSEITSTADQGTIVEIRMPLIQPEADPTGAISNPANF